MEEVGALVVGEGVANEAVAQWVVVREAAEEVAEAEVAEAVVEVVGATCTAPSGLAHRHVGDDALEWHGSIVHRKKRRQTCRVCRNSGTLCMPLNRSHHRPA